MLFYFFFFFVLFLFFLCYFYSDGGLKLLQITDDGDGINSADLNVICGRHCTSKMSSIEDLRGIQTFGFRGEALSRF
jgi:DNA mismatch repair ATPase MutL